MRIDGERWGMRWGMDGEDGNWMGEGGEGDIAPKLREPALCAFIILNKFSKLRLNDVFYKIHYLQCN